MNDQIFGHHCQHGQVWIWQVVTGLTFSHGVGTRWDDDAHHDDDDDDDGVDADGY